MTIETLETSTQVEPPRRQGISVRALALGALILLLVGIVGGGMAVNYYVNDGRMPDVAAQMLGGTAGEPTIPNPAQVMDTSGPRLPATAGDADALYARVNDLEQRLARISLEAQSASGNATRAEGLLVAFAVRRALDRGLPLGYLDPQLRLRFGDAQPNAVKTILDAARNPITIEQLRGQLEALVPQLMGQLGGDSDSFWTALRREMNEMLVFRSADQPSTNSTDRLERIRRYLSAAQVDKAISEVEVMPGAKVAGQWLIDARRYHEARRALDLVETAAILEPRESAPAAAITAPTTEAASPPLDGTQSPAL